MKNTWLKVIAISILVLLSIGFTQRQSTGLSQAERDRETRTVVIDDVKIIVKRSGVYAWNLKTGKILWRYEPMGFIFTTSFINLGDYVFFMEGSGSSVAYYAGRFVNTKTGEQPHLGEVPSGFYLKEKQKYYFDTSDQIFDTNNSIYLFGNVQILEFDVITKKTQKIVFETGKNLNGSGCDDIESNSAQYFKFKQKQNNLWIFTYSTKLCQMILKFNSTDVLQFDLKITRKAK